MSETFSKVEVISDVARRRRFSTELKLAVVAETMQPGMSISYLARRHGLSRSLVFRWRRLMSEGGKEAVRADDEVVAASEARRLEERVRELERLLGRKTMEVDILKEALELARAKNPSCCRTRRLREYPEKAISTTLAVARSNLMERRDRRQPSRGPEERAGGLELSGAIRNSCRRSPDLRVPEDRRAIKARAAIRRFGPGQCQARL